MARGLTERQQAALDYLVEHGDATIQEVADATGMAYPTAAQALNRLWWLAGWGDGGVRKERLGDGTNKVVYRWSPEAPDSEDEFERLYMAPAAVKK